jgi:HEAT repeat protein
LPDRVKDLLQDEEFGRLPDIVSMGEEAVPVLTDVLSGDADPLMRQRAAIALGRIGAPTAADALMSALDDPNPPVAIAAIDGVSRLRHGAAMGRIRRLVEHEDPSVRRHAVTAIGAVGEQEDKTLLQEVIGRDASDAVRDAASRAMRTLLDQP